MQFYNTRTKKLQELTTIKPNKLGMYVCGPTVYASPHIGNARSAVIYDLLFRLMREKFGADNVTYVRNVTDVDDKINAAAKQNGETIQSLTARVTADYHDILDKLGCLRPTIEPKATEHIAEMVDIIQTLIANGNAYVAENHVLFDVSSDPKYGHLSGRSQDEMIAGARVEVAPYKRNGADFVLWKPADAEDDESAKFDSPWGKGRPGWHIECTAMSTKYLGVDFDIHGGGLDLTFPHHENEIAQACCAHKGSGYANFWIHNGFLTVNGEKMSKSLGNFITVRDLLDKGVSGEVIRWALLSSHYRKPLDWNDKLLSDSKKNIDSFYREGWAERTDIEAKPESYLIELLEDDLNVAKVFAYLIEQTNEYNKTRSIDVGIKLIRNLKFMGFLQWATDKHFGRDDKANEVENLINMRKEAKAAKDYKLADSIRNTLDEMGIIIEDKAGGVVEWRRK